MVFTPTFSSFKVGLWCLPPLFPLLRLVYGVYPHFFQQMLTVNRSGGQLCGVMANMLTSRAVDRGFKSLSG
jgi:hypothetical protein